MTNKTSGVKMAVKSIDMYTEDTDLMVSTLTLPCPALLHLVVFRSHDRNLSRVSVERVGRP